MSSFSQQVGILRSLLMYYGIPFRIRQLSRFYSLFVQPGNLCFDIGAHVGNHLLALYRLQSANWLNSDEMTTLLKSLPVDANSGDVYARSLLTLDTQ